MNSYWLESLSSSVIMKYFLRDSHKSKNFECIIMSLLIYSDTQMPNFVCNHLFCYIENAVNVEISLIFNLSQHLGVFQNDCHQIFSYYQKLLIPRIYYMEKRFDSWLS